MWISRQGEQTVGCSGNDVVGDIFKVFNISLGWMFLFDSPFSEWGIACALLQSLRPSSEGLLPKSGHRRGI